MIDIYRTGSEELGAIVTRKEKEALGVGFGALPVSEVQERERSP